MAPVTPPLALSLLPAALTALRLPLSLHAPLSTSFRYAPYVTCMPIV